MLFFRLLALLLCVHVTTLTSSSSSTTTTQDPPSSSISSISFTYNNFKSSEQNLTLDGITSITSNGLLALTNHTVQKSGHAFHNTPIQLKSNGSAFSFATTFIFAIRSEYPVLSGHGVVFVISPTKGLPGALPSQYLGLFNDKNNGNASNHVVAVELDTIESNEFGDINNNHVGIDINGLHSVDAQPAGYYVANDFKNLSLISGDPMQVWVEYDAASKRLNVTMAPFEADKPSRPLMSYSIDLSTDVNESMYVGFSSSTGSVLSSHYVLGWSFITNSLQAPELDYSQLPSLPRLKPKEISKFFTIGLPIILGSLFILVVCWVVDYLRRKKKFSEELEDWELDYGPHRFKFKDLYVATKGFREKELLGSGGFGRVYKGILPSSKLEVAVKRISHESRQGMREFVAEIVSIGRLRHRNLVQLLGYCRRKGELLLVYDYMPNGSLDKFLFNKPEVTLNWRQRYRVIKGVASGLCYLHEEWEQVVIHRDIKASNVLLDAELNGRLGDFGLARLYDHGTDPQTTRVVGTLGYLAPEHSRTGRATTSTDVYSFGAFLLEVATGRRPIEPRDDDFFLLDWVFSYWSNGEILEAKDPNLGSDYVEEELELVLKLGLLCSHSLPTMRPSMRQVIQYLEGDMLLPDLSSFSIPASGLSSGNRDGFSDFAMSYASSVGGTFFTQTSIADSLLSQGR
ncbi:hypothetical protein ACFE04_002756 [Oxalis oulophora]